MQLTVADQLSLPARDADLPAELAVIVPTFNERDNIAALLDQLTGALAGIAWEVIFVDDNSPDGTAEIVREIARHDPRVRGMMRLGRRGLAGACTEGVLATSASFVAVMDADLQHDARLLPRMLAQLQADAADIVIGSRYASGGSLGVFAPVRSLGSRLSTRLAQLVIPAGTTDPMSGFFMMRRELFVSIAPSLVPEGFKILFDILGSARREVRVLELPYAFGERGAGTSKLDLRNMLDFVGLLASKASNGLVPVRFVSFLIVGASGVVVHLGALKAGLLAGASFLLAQVVATVVAMTSNFALNNTITYRDLALGGAAAVRGLFLFYAICSTGALCNVGVAAWLHTQHPVWWIAGLAGSIVGAAWNYGMANRFLWRA